MDRKRFRRNTASVAGFSRHPFRRIDSYGPRGGFSSARVKALPYSRATRADTAGGASFSSAKRWRYTPRFSLTRST